MDISVIIPLYNGEKYIRQTLESIMSQTFSGEWEVIISDDNSTDSSHAIISDFLKQYKGSRLIYRKNKVNCGYVNYAIASQYASGKYLAICDQDDLWTDTLKLQKQFDYMESHPDVGMTCSYFSSFYSNDSSTPPPPPHTHTHTHTHTHR